MRSRARTRRSLAVNLPCQPGAHWTLVQYARRLCVLHHGAGSRHVAWAQDRKSWWPGSKQEDRTKGLVVQFDERAGTTWTQNDKTGMPQRNGMPLGSRKEVETCGLCHARRAQFSEKWVPGQPLANTHLPTPMYRHLTYADGQMRDIEELYNYLPFKQSKMFASGVTCSDCHDPHSAALRAPGDGVCLQCHTPAKYTSASHHHHVAGRPARPPPTPADRRPRCRARPGRRRRD